MKPIYFFLLPLMLLLSCEREDVIPKNVQDLEFDCPAGQAESFFEGFMDDQEFCYYDGVDGYNLEISMSSAFVTLGPSASTNPNPDSVQNFAIWGNIGFRPDALPSSTAVSNLPHLKHYLFIETPSVQNLASSANLFRDHLKEVGELPLQSDVIDQFSGFNILFRYSDLDEHVNQDFKAFGGNQDDSYLRITALDIDQDVNITTYTITFEFACNLYYNGNPKRRYGRIENGVMRVRFTV